MPGRIQSYSFFCQSNNQYEKMVPPNSSLVSVVVFHPHPLLRTGICEVLAGRDHIEVCGLAGDLPSLRERLAGVPRAVLVAGGFSASQYAELRRLTTSHLSRAVLFLVSDPEELFIVSESVPGRPYGFLQVSAAPHLIAAAIVKLARGVTVVDPGLRPVTRELLDQFEGLSTREMQVLRHLAWGRSNAEIADALYISIHTVKKHVAQIIRKMQVNCRTGAIGKAYRIGMLPRGFGRLEVSRVNEP